MRYKFQPRWRIEGLLTTQSPLHIGDGGRIGREKRSNPSAEDAKPYLSTVARDHRNHAYVPGSALKGTLRSWARERLGDYAIANRVFGKLEASGKAEFCDAHAVEPAQSFEPGREWNAARLTCAATRTAVNRVTRTASDEKLFQMEFVPAGVTFKIAVCGAGWTDAEAEFILFVLEALNDRTKPAQLGAETVSGFGRCAWSLSNIFRLGANGAAVAAWLENGGAGYEKLPELPEIAKRKLIADSRAIHATLGDHTKKLIFAIHLRFEGPFLVNDSDPTVTGAAPLPNHAPLREKRDGRPFLPGTSFRGALRSQCERIQRTIGGLHTSGYPDQEDYLDRFTVHSEAELRRKLQDCPVSRLFGAPGWRAPLHVSDFKSVSDVLVELQHFVAIDRFTGGSAEHLKFNAEAAQFPQFAGTLTVDLKRLENAGGDEHTMALLAYTLRDLVEGDIRFGFGAAKGYGAVRAEVRLQHAPQANEIPQPFRNGFETWLGRFRVPK